MKRQEMIDALMLPYEESGQFGIVALVMRRDFFENLSMVDLVRIYLEYQAVQWIGNGEISHPQYVN